jgi:hypothetical protein
LYNNKERLHELLLLVLLILLYHHHYHHHHHYYYYHYYYYYYYYYTAGEIQQWIKSSQQTRIGIVLKGTVDVVTFYGTGKGNGRRKWQRKVY